MEWMMPNWPGYESLCRERGIHGCSRERRGRRPMALFRIDWRQNRATAPVSQALFGRSLGVGRDLKARCVRKFRALRLMRLASLDSTREFQGNCGDFVAFPRCWPVFRLCGEISYLSCINKYLE